MLHARVSFRVQISKPQPCHSSQASLTKPCCAISLFVHPSQAKSAEFSHDRPFLRFYFPFTFHDLLASPRIYLSVTFFKTATSSSSRIRWLTGISILRITMFLWNVPSNLTDNFKDDFWEFFFIIVQYIGYIFYFFSFLSYISLIQIVDFCSMSGIFERLVLITFNLNKSQ